MIDLKTAIQKIKNTNFLDSNIDYETLIKELGLNLEIKHRLPKSWYPFIKDWEKYCDCGLRTWQEPKQFGDLLHFLHEYLSNNQINSYLEIGSRHGGTFIWIDSMLRAFNSNINSYAVDIAIYGETLKAYQEYTNNINFIKADSTDPVLWTKLPNTIDMILVDGNHAYEYALADYYNSLYKKPKLILFHDINNETCPGIIRLWKEIIEHKTKNIDYYEFITENCAYYGIGVYILRQD